MYPIVMYGRIRMTIDPRTPTMPGRGTSDFHRPDTAFTKWAGGEELKDEETLRQESETDRAGQIDNQTRQTQARSHTNTIAGKRQREREEGREKGKYGACSCWGGGPKRIVPHGALVACRHFFGAEAAVFLSTPQQSLSWRWVPLLLEDVSSVPSSRF